MKFQQPHAQLYVPDGKSISDALSRITHLGIGAHQDDLEFMAYHGILTCYEAEDQWFGGVTCTNGAGSARTGAFSKFSDEEMQIVRRQEQNQAADLGRYAAMIQLDYPSSTIKTPDNPAVGDLIVLLEAARPEVVYTHNPADKHDTHIAVLSAVLEAILTLPREDRPRQLLGCEVWRGLDWMMDDEKVALDVSGNPALAQRLNRLFASQIAGGKRYDEAILGRRRANATFFDSHQVDTSNALSFAMDLTTLIHNETLNVSDVVMRHIERFVADVRKKLNTFDL